MKAIIISDQEFLVNTYCEEAKKLYFADSIICIDRTKVHDEGQYCGGTSENVPDYCLSSKEDWEKAAQKHPVIDLKSEPTLAELFWTASNALEAQFESTEDFVFSHGYWPLNA